MKKILLLLLLLLVLSGGFLAWKMTMPKPVDLDVVVEQEDVASLEEKLDMDLPDMEEINAKEETVTITEYTYQETELNNEETSLLMNLALSSFVPCSNVQAVCHEGYVEVSALVKLPDELKEMTGLPAALIPEKMSGTVTVEMEDTDVNVTSIKLNGIPVPSQVREQLNSILSDTLKSQGYQEIRVHENRMVVKGKLPSKVE